MTRAEPDDIKIYVRASLDSVGPYRGHQNKRNNKKDVLVDLGVSLLFKTLWSLATKN